MNQNTFPFKKSRMYRVDKTGNLQLIEFAEYTMDNRLLYSVWYNDDFSIREMSFRDYSVQNKEIFYFKYEENFVKLIKKYDEKGNLKEEILINEDYIEKTKDKSTEKFNYFYDEHHNCILTEINYSNGGSTKISYEYNNFNQKIKENRITIAIIAGSEEFISVETDFFYENDILIKSISKLDSSTFCQGYNNKGDLIYEDQIYLKNSTLNTIKTYDYVYDEHQNIIEIKHWDNYIFQKKITRKYNEENLIIEECNYDKEGNWAYITQWEYISEEEDI